MAAAAAAASPSTTRLRPMSTLTLHPFAPRATAAPVRLLLVLAVHLLALGLLVQTGTVRRVLQAPHPLVVSLIGEPAPAAAQPLEPAAPAPRRPAPLLPMPADVVPEVTLATAAPAPQITPSPTPSPAPAQPSVPAPPAAAAAAAAAAVAPPAALPAPQPTASPTPAAPKQVPAGAVRYRVPPAVEVPMASRRLGEQGTVQLRVWVDARGVPKEVLLHRSSGFARLDEQAIQAMRQARFQPLAENGQAIEWVVIAPLQYELD